MKTFGLLVVMFVVIALAAGVEKSYALAEGDRPMTCSGQYTEFGAQNFFIGYSDEKGNCGVESFYANSEGEAFSCAQEKFKDYSLQDLTDLYKLGSAQTGNNPGEQFCPKK